MATAGERRIVRRMQMEPGFLPFPRRLCGAQSASIETALAPLLAERSTLVYALRSSERAPAWSRQFTPSVELPTEIRKTFDRIGHGCRAAVKYIGVVEICHAAYVDINGVANVPVLSPWQLIEILTAPLIRLELVTWFAQAFPT